MKHPFMARIVVEPIDLVLLIMVTSICTNNDCQYELGKVGKVRPSICDWFNLVVKKGTGDRLVRSHIKQRADRCHR